MTQPKIDADVHLQEERAAHAACKARGLLLAQALREQQGEAASLKAEVERLTAEVARLQDAGAVEGAE